MKVLFAVNNESISESIIKLYQKEYREIISGKNVYYFNAIVKELQRDQTYDRVVISEDLEPYTNNNFDIIDKFLFEQLDKISDEAISGGGSDIPIIFIAADRRSKSDNLLSKLFSIGMYDALLGSDRTIPEVCKLLNKPRTKKEAKTYYKIETEEVSYQAESEDSVSETEIQNILTHYKKLGKNQDRYVESFNNIAAQYNDAQLRIITKFLPIGVKAVLEAESPKYQSIMTFGEGTYKKQAKEEKKNDLKIGFIETNASKNRLTRPVVIPSSVDTNNVRKLTKKVENNNNNINVNNIPNEPVHEEKQTQLDFEQFQPIEPKTPRRPIMEEDAFSDLIPEKTANEEPIVSTEGAAFGSLSEEIPEIKGMEEQPVKRGRGRPRKVVPESEKLEEATPKRRGRPKKQVEPEEENMLPGFDEIDENTLPGFDELEENTLPGFDEIENDTLPNIEEKTAKIQPNPEPTREIFRPMGRRAIEKQENEQQENMNLYNLGGKSQVEEDNQIQTRDVKSETGNLARLLSKDKKVVAFVGTSKAGTSFLINNIADYFAKSGINTAILDVTSNKNSYYIYTKNEEQLRRKVQNCLESLEQNIVDGINVSRNLTVFTSVPGKRVEVQDVESVISALVKEFSLVLIDTDFQTPYEYFALAQEIYLVQSMDILTIQPLTAFLRDLQSNNILKPEKLKAVINKTMRVRGLTTSAIIGGMSCYNDPEMSFMRELFDKDKIPNVTISFDEDVLSKYLSGMVDCIVTTNGYSKQFMSELKKLAEMVYPLVNNRFRPNYEKNNKFANNNKSEEMSEFTRSMNSTLDMMKKQFK